MAGVKVLLTTLLIFLFIWQSFGQIDSIVESQLQKQKNRGKSPNNACLITPFYTALFPLGILSDRYGFCNNVGLNISYKFKRNWIFGVEGAYIFGSRVKEDPITNSIATYSSPAQIIGNDGSLLTPNLELSGFEVALRLGKLIPINKKKHPNSGFVISLSAGYLQHKIKITANTNNFPQLDPTYKLGYDRLTSGTMLNGYFGYLFLEKRKFLSFTAGLEYTLGFTQNRRNWDFDLMSSNTELRYDMLIGIKLGWVIPVFTNKSNQVYY